MDKTVLDHRGLRAVPQLVQTLKSLSSLALLAVSQLCTIRPLTFDDAMENTVVQYLRLARHLQDSRQQRSRPCRSTG